MSIPVPTRLGPAVPVVVPDQDRDHLGSIALDQWRGLAVVLVLISHGFYFTGRVHGIGRVGVNLFFFISGILVFRSLSRTRAATDWKRTQSFWWRRFRRLYPALLTYALAMFAGTWLLQPEPNLPPNSDLGSYVKTMPLAIVYAINYFEQEPMSLGHLWSLSCEMQFYLLAPLIYWAAGRTEIRRNLLFGGLLVALTGLGLAQPFFGKGKYHFEFAVWPMMLGFCCEYRRVWFERLSERLVRWALWSSAAICGLSMVLMLAGLEMKILVIVIGALLLAPCLLAYLFGCPMPGVAGLCLKWMGERTYSIYLWQQPFTICRFLPQILHPVGAVVSVAVGGAWFHWFERPFLSVSRRPEKSPPASRFFWWPKIIAGLAAILLLVALVVVLISRPRYEATLRRQIWPVNPQPLSVQSGPSSGVAGTLLLLGDSRMAEWGVPEFGQWKVVNAGTVGFTTGQVRLRASEVLEEFRPDTVVLQAGINDLKYLGLEPEMVSPIVSLAYSNIVAIVDECVRHHSRIVVLETWPAGRPPLLRRLVWSDQIASGVEQLNAALRGLDAPHNGVRVVDLFRSAALNAEGDEYRDTLHFKPEFYRRLTPVLARELGSPPSAK